jgi:hypothetical protein
MVGELAERPVGLAIDRVEHAEPGHHGVCAREPVAPEVRNEGVDVDASRSPT